MYLVAVCDHTFQREKDLPAFSSCEHRYWRDLQGKWRRMGADPWTFLEGKFESASRDDRAYAPLSLGLLTCADNLLR